MVATKKTHTIPKKGEFEKLAYTRIAEAKLLFDNKYYSAAFYMAGYAIECALKTRLANNFHKLDIPDWEVIKETYTHDLQSLLKQNGLDTELGKLTKQGPEYALNWDVIAGIDGWSEQTRYNINITKDDARRLISAIENPKNGILLWILKS